MNHWIQLAFGLLIGLGAEGWNACFAGPAPTTVQASPSNDGRTVTADLFSSRSQQPYFPDSVTPPVLSPPGQWSPVAGRIDSLEDGIPMSGRPRGIPIGLEGEWITDSDVGLATYKSNITIPILFGRNSPPPFIKIGFEYTDVTAADSAGLPDDLYEYSVGLNWLKRYNDRWAVFTMLGVGLATDNENTSSEAWRFRGGVFATYKRNEQWKWTFGAIALGRSDLPVIPVIGAVWQPSPVTRIDLMFPKPTANFLLTDNGQRQQWAYLGGGINGKTWGFDRPGIGDDSLTYSDVRLVAGWQSKPSAPPGVLYVPGRKYEVEVGYVFSRDIEFDNDPFQIEVDDGIMLRLSTSY